MRSRKRGAAKTWLPIYVYTGTARHVGSGQTYANVKSAIAAAVDGDAILIHAGTYVGNDNKNLNLGAKKVVLMGFGNADEVILDCEDKLRAFHFDNAGDAQAVVANLTIRHGFAGAMRMVGDEPTVSVTPRIVSVTFDGNSNGDNGGAVSISGSGAHPAFYLCNFLNNTTANLAYNGGAIAVENGAKLDLFGGVVSQNSAFEGGGLHGSLDSVLTLNEVVVANNGAQSYGPAIYAPGTFSMVGGTIADHVGNGSHAALWSGTATLTDVHIRDNSRACSFQTATVTGCTFSGNSLTAVEYYYQLTMSETKFFGNLGILISDSGSQYGANTLTNIEARGNSAQASYLIGMTHPTGIGLDFQDNTVANGHSLIYARAGKFSGCTLRNNTVTAGGGTPGHGGFYSDDGNLEVRDSVLEGNTAESGAAIAVYGQGTSGVVLENLLITGNKALGAGGGIWLEASTLPAVLRGLTVANNGATTGAGIFLGNAKLALTASIVWGNVPTDPVGGQFFVDGTQPNAEAIVQVCNIANTGDDIADPGGKINGTGFATGDSDGNVSADPGFVTGPGGGFYLSQTASGQVTQSLCADPTGGPVLGVGDVSWGSRTTRTDGTADTGSLDMGWHYQP